MTLRINLKNDEQVIVNGAVLRANGRAELRVENRASVLRGREVMQPEEATTPARRLYLACTLAYVDEIGRTAHQDRIVNLVGDLLARGPDDRFRQTCLDFIKAAAMGDYYNALTVCRELMRQEAAAGRAPEAEPA